MNKTFYCRRTTVPPHAHTCPALLQHTYLPTLAFIYAAATFEPLRILFFLPPPCLRILYTRLLVLTGVSLNNLTGVHRLHSRFPTTCYAAAFGLSLWQHLQQTARWCWRGKPGDVACIPSPLLARILTLLTFLPLPQAGIPQCCFVC